MVRTAGRVYLALFASTFLVYTDLLLRKWHFVTRPSISLPDIMDGWDGTGRDGTGREKRIRTCTRIYTRVCVEVHRTRGQAPVKARLAETYARAVRRCVRSFKTRATCPRLPIRQLRHCFTPCDSPFGFQRPIAFAPFLSSASSRDLFFLPPNFKLPFPPLRDHRDFYEISVLPIGRSTNERQDIRAAFRRK